MAADDVTVTISGAAVASSNDAMQVTIGPASTTLPPASSGGSGFYQNLGDGRGYLPMNLFIGT